MHALVPRAFGLVLERTGVLGGDVLHKRPAEGDIGNLSTAADGEERDTTVAGDARERDLVGVAGLMWDTRRRMRRSAIAGRIHVLPAGEHNAADAASRLFRQAGVERRNDERNYASRSESVGICLIDADARPATDFLGRRRNENGRRTVRI